MTQYNLSSDLKKNRQITSTSEACKSLWLVFWDHVPSPADGEEVEIVLVAGDLAQRSLFGVAVGNT